MYNEFYLQLSFCCAIFFLLLDYALGKPGSDKWNEKGFLSIWIIVICKLRLKQLGFGKWVKDNKPDLKPYVYKKNVLETKYNYYQLIYSNTNPLFGWIMILGICPICTHFWWSLLTFIFFDIWYLHINPLTFITYFLLSHLLIRLFKIFL